MVMPSYWNISCILMYAAWAEASLSYSGRFLDMAGGKLGRFRLTISSCGNFHVGTLSLCLFFCSTPSCEPFGEFMTRIPASYVSSRQFDKETTCARGNHKLIVGFEGQDTDLQAEDSRDSWCSFDGERDAQHCWELSFCQTMLLLMSLSFAPPSWTAFLCRICDITSTK